MSPSPIVPSMKILLVTGAPRSGTTALAAYLGTHPNILLYPFEAYIFYALYRIAEPDREDYLRNRYYQLETTNDARIGRRTEYAAHIERKRLEFPDETFPEFDSDAFLQTFLERFDTTAGPPLFRFLVASVYGTQAGYGNTLDDRITVFGFKLPYYIAINASDISNDLEEVIFVHIDRNLIERYLSAKLRNLATKPNARLKAVGRWDNPTFAAMVTASCKTLCEYNQQAIAHYLATDYAGFIANKQSVLADIYALLNLPACPIGPDPKSGSSSWKGSLATTKNRHIFRSDNGNKLDALTNLPERVWLTLLGDLIAGKPVSMTRFLRARLLWHLPFHREEYLAYLRRIARSPSLPWTSNKLMPLLNNELPQWIRAGKAQISGAV